MSKLPTPNSQLPNPKPKIFDIKERCFEFAVKAIEIVEQLPNSPGGWTVASQLAKSGSSVGANVEEADGADSKADKRRSLIIARKEARESRFWLRVIDRRWPRVADVKPHVGEASELVAILSTMIRKLNPQ